jgi:hypothetical protein
MNVDDTGLLQPQRCILLWAELVEGSLLNEYIVM